MRLFMSLFILLVGVSCLLSAQNIMDVKGYKALGFTDLPDVDLDNGKILILPSDELLLVGIDKDKTIHIIKYDDDGNKLTEHQSSVDSLLKIHEVYYTAYGRLLIGGTILDASEEKKAALLLFTEKGQLLAKKKFEDTNEASTVNFILQNNDGDILTAYYSKSSTKTQLFRIERDSMNAPVLLKKVNQEPNIIGHYQIHDYCIKDTVKIAFTGERSGRTFFHIIDFRGNSLISRPRFVGLPSCKKGLSIIYAPHINQFIIGGEYKQSSSASSIKAFLAFVQEDGELVQDKLLAPLPNQKINGSISHIDVQKNGSILCIGDYERSGYFRFWVAELNLNLTVSDNKPAYKYFYPGSYSTLAFFHYLHTKNSWLLVERQSPDIPNFGLAQLPSLLSTEHPRVEIKNIEWVDEVRNDTLETSERSCLKIHWKATASQRGSFQLNPKLNTVYGLNIPQNYTVNVLPGQQEGIANIPLVATDSLLSSKINGKIVASASDGSILGEAVIDEIITSRKTPLLYFKNARFFINSKEVTLKDTIQRRDTLTAKITIGNKGRITAKGVLLYLKLPYHVEELTSIYGDTASLATGDTIEFTFKVMPFSYYEHDRLQLAFFASEKAGNDRAFKVFNIPVPDFYLVKPKNGLPYIPKEIIIERQNKGGFYDMNLNPTYNDNFGITLLSPSEATPVSKTARISFKIEIIARDIITKDQIRIWRTIASGTKEEIKEIDTDFNCFDKLIRVDFSDSGEYEYTYWAQLLLERNKDFYNEFEIQITETSGKKMTQKISVEYTPPIRRLWVYCIGMPSGSAKEKDVIKRSATAVYEYYQEMSSQNGIYFDSIFPILKVQEDGTTREAIRSFLNSIGAKFNENHNHKSNIEDIIFFYICSHGTGRAGFSLLCSDYQNDNTNKFSFRSLIDDLIGELPVAKYLFLDACFSGKTHRIIMDPDLQNLIDENYHLYLTTSSLDSTFINYNQETVLSTLMQNAMDSIQTACTSGLLSFDGMEKYIEDNKEKVFEEIILNKIYGLKDLPKTSSFISKEKDIDEAYLYHKTQKINNE